MAFTRNFLKSTGLTDDQITAVIEEHTAVTDALKKERDGYKEQADKANDLQKQLDDIANGEDFKKKYEDEHKAFEDFKKQTESEAQTAKVRSAYRKLLAEEGISEKRLDAILKVTDLSKVKMDKDGNFDNADELKKAINDEWGEFKTTVSEKGAVVERPPQIGKATKTKAEIYAIKDTRQRQQAIAENHELFGF